MGDYPWFPMFVDLSERRALIVGGGRVAARRAAALSQFCGHIEVVAPEILPEIGALAGVSVVKRPFEDGDLHGVDLALLATDDAALNARAAALCREMGIPVNVCSDPSLCDFYFPGVAVRAGAVVGVTASGRDHRRAAALTRRARAMLAEEGGGADEFQP